MKAEVKTDQLKKRYIIKSINKYKNGLFLKQ